MENFTTQHKAVLDSLMRIPFFRGLPPETLLAISSKLHRVHFAHDEIVFVEDSLGDAMYLIESGQVKVSVNTGPGQQERVINYLGPGNFFGEMALLLNQRRTATVTVTIDADFWMLRKADMDELLIDHPEIALQITKELSRRLSDVVTESSRRPGYNLTAVFGVGVCDIARHIHTTTRQKVVVLNITGQNLYHQAGPEFQEDTLVLLEAPEATSSEALIETLSILADGFDWVLMALAPTYSEVNVKAVQLAKAIILCNVPEESWITENSDEPIIHCQGTPEEIGRTARKITHRVVGLALSSGGARGIAHIGVLETLEKANIPIDIIVGTSAGSLFGGLYALGKSIAEITDFARGLIKLIDFKSGLWDPKFSLPWDGLIKGNATLKYLDKHFNHATFADTKIPCYVVAADVLSGEEIVFERGLLAQAVRASIGMIGIFSPYQLNGHYLIDGGAVNPVPASILAEKGANIIIASSVIPSIEEERARGQALANRSERPNFLGVLNSMMAIMEREIVKTRMSPVDVLIKPKVEIFTSMDYDKADGFLRLGREATEQQLPLLKQLLTN
jgi:predicted acylesterase/phospholipase RssA/CRP-like cAMP-binding protein